MIGTHCAISSNIHTVVSLLEVPYLIEAPPKMSDGKTSQSEEELNDSNGEEETPAEEAELTAGDEGKDRESPNLAAELEQQREGESASEMEEALEDAVLQLKREVQLDKRRALKAERARLTQ